jgi:hypothetical protein
VCRHHIEQHHLTGVGIDLHLGDLRREGLMWGDCETRYNFCPRGCWPAAVLATSAHVRRWVGHCARRRRRCQV